MPMFNTYEAKTKLSSLIKAALNGEEVIIANANHPAVKLIPYDLSLGNGFKFGVMRGKITLSSDFDEPLSDDELALFEGEKST